MSRRNTRLRVTRIAAAAVIAAGASLTVAGVAQAAVDGTTSVTVTAEGDPATPPTVEPPTTPPTVEPPTTPPTVEPPTTPPTVEPPTTPPTTPPTVEPPTTPPTLPPTEGTIAGVIGGNDDGGATAAPSPTESTGPGKGQAPGHGKDKGKGNGSASGGNTNTCTLTGDSVDCGNNPGTDSTQQVPQGTTTQQLAETGSNGTTFLVVGAATMIAGGIGFRLTPRLAGARRDAA